MNKSSGSMAKRSKCAVKKTDTKKLKRDLKGKQSRANVQVKKENAGMKISSCIHRYTSLSHGCRVYFLKLISVY